MAGFWRLRFLRLRKSGIWSGMRLFVLLFYIAVMVFVVFVLIKKTKSVFGYNDDTEETPESLVADRSLSSRVHDDVLHFEAQFKPGLGAHGQAVRFPEQSEKDIEDQLKVRSPTSVQ